MRGGMSWDLPCCPAHSHKPKILTKVFHAVTRPALQPGGTHSHREQHGMAQQHGGADGERCKALVSHAAHVHSRHVHDEAQEALRGREGEQRTVGER